MREEYDFSKGERGKFYHPDAVFHFPVYLDQDIADFLRQFAEQKNMDVDDIVNDWLRRDIGLVKAEV